MDLLDENEIRNRERHGCVTAFLILMIIGNALTAVTYVFMGDMIAQNFPGGISTSMLMLLSVIGIANVVFAVSLWQWKRWGFYGFLASSVITLAINLSIGVGIGQSFGGLIGIAILYGVLQMQQSGSSGWDNLE